MNSLEDITIDCPYCGETVDVTVDCSRQRQRYVEDCPVCCAPMDVNVELDEAGYPAVTASREGGR